MQHISRTSSFLLCPEVNFPIMAKLDMAKNLQNIHKWEIFILTRTKIHKKRQKVLHLKLYFFLPFLCFAIINEITSAYKKRRLHYKNAFSFQGFWRIWQIVLSCGSLARKKKKKISENRICFGESNAVGFLGIGLVSSLKGYFHLAHQVLRFFLSVACSILKKYYSL